MPNSNQRLFYVEQLSFKKAWMKAHNVKKDLFYFDYMTGVDAGTSRNIPGIFCDGSLTWAEADNILCKHFKI